MITVDLQGFDTIAERLKTASETVFKEVDAEIGATTQDMVALAKRNAPKDQGLLSGEISSFQERPLRWAFVSQASYSAFVEFGTKSNVRIPAGLESFAGSFKGGFQSSLSAKEAIFEWCRRHGIERRAWYAIFIKIMTKGVSGRNRSSSLLLNRKNLNC
jgi:hypothetical protein